MEFGSVKTVDAAALYPTEEIRVITDIQVCADFLFRKSFVNTHLYMDMW